MAMFLVMSLGIIFMFGLVLWARSGAALWEINELLRSKRVLLSAGGKMKMGEHDDIINIKKNIQKTIQRREITMDSLLMSSFKILGLLAICVWIFVAFSFVMDSLGDNWADKLGFSSHRISGSPIIHSKHSGNNFSWPQRAKASNRNDRLYAMGSRFNR